MPLVKLTNTGTETFKAMFNGKPYTIPADPEEGTYVIVDTAIAKHWLGDWDIPASKEEDRERERMRVMLLMGSEHTYKIKVYNVIEEKKLDVTSDDFRTGDLDINPNVTPPVEKEFEDLDDVKNAVEAKKSKRVVSEKKVK